MIVRLDCVFQQYDTGIRRLLEQFFGLECNRRLPNSLGELQLELHSQTATSFFIAELLASDSNVGVKNINQSATDYNDGTRTCQ